LALAEVEITQLKSRKEKLEQELDEIIKNENKSATESRALIVEIRAGTGGEEAALFAADIYRMYSRLRKLMIGN